MRKKKIKQFKKKKSRSRPAKQCKNKTQPHISPILRSRTGRACKAHSMVSQANAVMFENNYGTSCLWTFSRRTDLIQPKSKAIYLYKRVAAIATQNQLTTEIVTHADHQCTITPVVKNITQGNRFFLTGHKNYFIKTQS